MPEVSAPYNFVPLNKEVYFPEWGPFISHDIPFRDGLSGKIKLKITAESPIFVGSGEEVNGVKQFCKDSKGNYFIPGSSIRNMLRSVIEIMSFGTLNFIDKSKVKSMKRVNLKKIVINFQNGDNTQLDLADCIFGTIEQKKLKGRVSVLPAFTEKKPETTQRIYTLSSPKASYYPFYIKQNFIKNTDKVFSYNEYKDSNAEINGRKRYLLKNLEINNKKFKPKIDSKIESVDSNTSFSTSLVYHNLKTEELGAILSGISFHQNENCRHLIGGAKPYGLGQVNIEILNFDEIEIKKHLIAYENIMRENIENWESSEQIKELFTMSSIKYKDANLNNKYMRLTEFAGLKNEKKAMRYFSKIINEKEKLSLISEQDIEYKKRINYKPNLETKIKEIKAKLKSLENLTNTVLENIEKPQVGDEYEAVIFSLKPRKVKLNVNNKEIIVQLIFSKHIDQSKFSVGQKIKIEINPLKKNGEINDVKYKQD